MKQFLIMAAAALVIGGGIFMYKTHTDVAPQVLNGPVYHSEHVGLNFIYPAIYTLTTRHDSYGGTGIHVLTLIASSTIPDMSDGPTAISVIEIAVATSTDLEAWVRKESISNFAMSSDKKFSTSTMDGEPALVYTYTGLYESDAIAVKHGAKIYLFAGSWLDATDRIRTDFKNIVSDVTFIP